DAYIADAPEFAQPILSELRERVHAACPDVEEAMKWSHPFFVYHGVMCNMASFKEHCAFGFWKGALIVGADSSKAGDAWGQFGRLTRVKDLPSKKIMTAYLKQAMKLNEEGISVPKTKAPAKKTAVLNVPAALAIALKGNRKALDTFDAFSPSQRKEYIEWVTEAKAEATRDRRIEQAIEWMADGRVRNWKYQK
ncbi:MAG: YdeI/OmpD-associated family protein, partial [Gemmatimonadaceae bacterium]